ncbi:MAG TPA: TetR/AcrR family transcriptional regulator [Terriglobales bacterium]|nr:TetR/AcrR family transcriptional regulator [Terriglobales bacterium]
MDTRETLIDHAIGIVRKTGYAGFSYADLSDAVGIRKPSIHHHFPAKGDLGLAIVETYRATFNEQLAAIRDTEASGAKRLKRYAGLYREALTTGSGCLCGVLAAEFANLPKPVQAAVRGFFADNTAWLASVLLEMTDADGHRPSQKAAQRSAQAILAGFQGALLSARAQNDIEIFDTTVATLIATVTP